MFSPWKPNRHSVSQNGHSHPARRPGRSRGEATSDRMRSAVYAKDLVDDDYGDDSYGEMQRATPPELVRALAQIIPDASYRLVPGCGHLPCIENPKFVSDLLEDLMEKIS